MHNGKNEKSFISMLNNTFYDTCLYDIKFPSVHCFMFVKLITFTLIVDGYIMKSKQMIIEQEDFQIL